MIMAESRTFTTRSYTVIHLLLHKPLPCREQNPAINVLTPIICKPC